MTRDWVDDFIRRHESRLIECGYHGALLIELCRARGRWFGGVK
jgi:hypothetical protein